MARPTRTGGKKSEAKSRNASPAKGRKTTKTQARIAPSATRVRPRSISDLSKDLKEAREQQAATAEILRVIASSPSDVQPVFDAIADSAKCLIGGFSTAVHRVIDDIDHLVAFTPTNAESDEALKAAFPRHRSEMPAIISLVENGETAQIVDSETADGQIRKLARARGWRSATYTPLMNQGTFIGFIVCTRREKGMLADHHVQLLRIFADQAVIAVENTRLFNETKEALEQQTATADVLKVISRSVFDLTSVMDTLTSSAAELCKAEVSALYLREGDVLVARGVAHADVAQVDFLRRTPLQVDDSTYIGRTFQTGAVRNIADVATESETGQLKRFGEILGFRSIVFVPLMRESRSVGIFALARMRTGQFSQREVELAQTFADQAVIAIENTRLFNETKEALERQTATSEVLEVISGSPGDLQPVFNAMLNNALRICEAKFGQLLLFDGTGFLAADLHNSPADYGNLFKEGPLIPGPNTGLGRLIATKTAVHIHDVVSGSLYAERDPLRIATVDILQARTLLAVPMLKDAELVGAVIIYRQEVRPFSDRQIELVTNFAAQGAIALENTRLLKELRGRTDDLSELLEQQTATSEVLEVISASTGELEPVFRKMLENATRICGANFGALSWYNAGSYQNVALYNIPGAFAEQMLAPIHPHPKSGLATIAKTLQVVQIEDLRTQPPYLEGDPAVVAISDLAGARTIVNVPMLRENELIGAISIYRQEVRPFTEKQIELVANFAKQAVIAIENTRLLKELRARTDDLSEALVFQTGSSNILKVIASSPTDVDPALKAIVESACEICEAYDALVFLKEGSDLVFSAHHGPIPINLERWPINRRWVTGRAVVDTAPQHIHDLLGPEGDDFPEGRELARNQGQRTVLSVPLLQEGEAIGVISLRRIEVQPFDDKQIELLKSFADQAVIAISNVRLFEEVQARTHELAESLEQQTATSEVLSVISRSAGDLAPVFDAMLGKAMQLCGANFGVLNTYDGSRFHTAATYGLPLAYDEFRGKQPLDYGPATAPVRLLSGDPFVQISDLLEFDAYRSGEPNRRALVDLGGAHCLLAVPLLKDERVTGNVMIFRQENRPFSEKQITLLQQFAAQAVIAIENARLLNELRQRTNDLSKSLDDLRTAQDRLIQTEKLASLGQLTAGIAHEIKNPLNFVNNFSALSAELTDELNDALKPVAMDSKVRGEVDELTGLLKDNLEKVVQHGKRADSIVKNMLLHSREGSGERRPIEINAIVDESLNLAYHGARAERPGFNITLQRDFDAGAGTVEAFPQEITRVLLNLISNGFYAATRRAAETGDGFEPTLRATTKILGDKVEIRIRDNGIGITAEIKEKIFNPFFTTKPAGEGTGLGLSMSHDIIVKQHGGTIDVDTEPGVFTEFIVRLPRSVIP